MIRALALSLVLLAGIVSVAQDPAPKPAPPKKVEPVRQIEYPAREINSSTLPLVPAPIFYDKAAELKNLIDDEEWWAKVGKTIDFSKERVAYFEWRGPATDKLTPDLEKDNRVVFVYKNDNTDDIVANQRLFVVPARADVLVDNQTKN
jgi:hypothetical protein